MKYTTTEGILTELGYRRAEVSYSIEILEDITDYLTSKGININELTHRDKGYKMVGTLYKYFWLKSNAANSVVLDNSPDVSDGEHYANHFWNRYGDDYKEETHGV